MDSNISSTDNDPDFVRKVRQRALELAQQRGMVEGHEWEDWFQAQKEIRESLTTSAVRGPSTPDDQTAQSPMRLQVRYAASILDKKKNNLGSKAVLLFQILAVCVGLLLIAVAVVIAIVFAGKDEPVKYEIALRNRNRELNASIREWDFPDTKLEQGFSPAA
jgi:hypothetical protein